MEGRGEVEEFTPIRTVRDLMRVLIELPSNTSVSVAGRHSYGTLIINKHKEADWISFDTLVCGKAPPFGAKRIA